MTAGKTHLGRIQALRFFASFAVLFAHLQREVGENLMPGVRFARFTLIDGGIGVDIFFVISGFIMYYIAGDDFGGGARASLQFIRRRLMRVAPLYFGATVLVLLVALTSGEVVASGPLTVVQTVASFLFIPWPNAFGQVVPILKLGWALNLQVYFYVVFAIALAWPRRTGLALLCVILVLMMAAARMVSGVPLAVVFWGQGMVAEFLAGIAIAIAYRHGWRAGYWQGWLLVLGGLTLAAGLRASGLAGHVDRAVFAGIPAALIFAGVAGQPSREAAGRWRGWLDRAQGRAGDASYALYLSHPFSIRAATLLWPRLGLPDAPWLFIVGVMLVAIAVSLAINRWIERPLDVWLRQWRAQTRVAASART
ncbi:acyltransferase family protein [Novosphingobium lentum]|uniref:acyltransferase family protein n=1 Tax=Novosphingobium lentum TaxID=145287 RepID=UPI00083658D7|nr:acyltransferase [Novosphingobium lentum]